MEFIYFFHFHLKSVYFLRCLKINVEGTHRPTSNPLLLGILQTLLAATENRKEVSKQKGGTYLHEGRGGAGSPIYLLQTAKSMSGARSLQHIEVVAGDAMISHDQPRLAMISHD